MAGGIFLVQLDNSLVELGEQGYVTEDVLQRYLADYPHLMAGDQIDPGSPRRWLFIKREAAVPSEDGGGGRWALDHLFLDQDAVPTLVEVKRASDTRIRREVVGQMLDYAANAVVYWPGDLIRAQFEGRCLAEGREPGQVLADFLGGEEQAEAFWQQARENLQAGKIRMIFVADVIPTELQRIVEFLDGQMNPARVMALEVRQFVGQGLTALVPKVIGQTAAAMQKKGSAGAGGATRYVAGSDEFEASIATAPAEERPQLTRLLDWAQGLETEGLVTLETGIGTANRWTLRPVAVGDKRGLVTIYNERGASLNFHSTVFARLAPSSLPAVEAAAAPAKVGQGTNTTLISDHLLAALTDAYREAAGRPTSYPDSRDASSGGDAIG